MINKQKNKISIDGMRRKKKPDLFLDLPMIRYIGKYKNSSILFSKKGITGNFFTQDSKLYITPAEYRKIEKGERIIRVTNQLDSALSKKSEKARIYSIGHNDTIFIGIKERYANLRNYIHDLITGAVQGVSIVKMWNLSIVGAVIFGMLTMTMIYRYLGQNVSAAIADNVAVNQAQEQIIEPEAASVGNNVVDFSSSQNDSLNDIDTDFVTMLLEKSDAQMDNSAFEQELREMVAGYPIEVMVSEIAKQDRIVAAFIIAIAKKESAWGVHVPVYQGQDCYNYWGYRGKNPVGSGGHTCFDSPADAVDTVAKRIAFLVSNKKLNTPREMVGTWKCGSPSNCGATGGQAAANKWAADVAMYFDKLNKK
jgi:hypothetical protein